MKFDITVVTVVRNQKGDRVDDIRKGLERLQNQTIDSDKLQLLLLDIGNEPGVTDYLKKSAAPDPSRLRYIDCSEPASDIKYYAAKEAEGEYTVFLNPLNRWTDDAFEEIRCYFENAPECFDVAVCCDGSKRFLHIYENGNRITDILDEPRDLVTSLNNTVFRTSALKEWLYTPEMTHCENSLVFITKMLMNNPKIGIIQSARLYKKKSNFPECSGNEKPSDYIRRTRKVYAELEKMSQERFGCVVPYVQNLILYDMRQYTSGKNNDRPFSENEKRVYIELLQEKLANADIGKICRAPGTTQFQRLGLLYLKYGDSIFEQSEFDEGIMKFRGHKVLNLSKPTAILRQASVSGKNLCFSFNIEAFPLKVRPVVFAMTDQNQRIDGNVKEEKSSSHCNRFGEALMQNVQCEFGFPVNSGQKISFFVQYGDDQPVPITFRRAADQKAESEDSLFITIKGRCLIKLSEKNLSICSATLRQRIGYILNGKIQNA